MAYQKQLETTAWQFGTGMEHSMAKARATWGELTHGLRIISSAVVLAEQVACRAMVLWKLVLPMQVA